MIAIVLLGGAFAAVVCGGILFATLIPAVSSAREAAHRLQCSNNLKQISLALHNYHLVWKTFPPAYTVDEAGNRLHSWRTLILPYIEQLAVYKQIDLTKPWNDPANLPFASLVIPTYQCPSTTLEPGTTVYVAVIDPQGVFSGPQPTELETIVDGTSNTLLITETDSAHAVKWMSPEDIDRSAFPLSEQHPNGCNCAMADGAVHFIVSSLDPAMRDALVTKDGGEDVGPLDHF